MKSDRFLTSILIGIGVLVVIALVFFFVRQGGQNYVSDDSPAGVTHNFILAVIKADYERAYQYMADNNLKPGLPAFRTALLTSRQGFVDYSAQVGDVQIFGDTANVVVILIFNSGNPFNGANRQQQSAQLVRQNGAWKVTQMPYPFWDFNWGNPVPTEKIPVAPAIPAPAVQITPTP
jgi:hypothetical protein